MNVNLTRDLKFQSLCMLSTKTTNRDLARLQLLIEIKPHQRLITPDEHE